MSAPFISKKRSAEEDSIPAIVLCSVDDSDAVKLSIERDLNASILIKLANGEPKREAKRVRFSEPSCPTPLLQPLPAVFSPPHVILPPTQYTPFVRDETKVDKDIINTFVGLIHRPDNSQIQTILLYIRFQEYLMANPRLLNQNICAILLKDIRMHYATIATNIKGFTRMLYEHSDNTTFIDNYNIMILHNRLSVSMSKMKAIIDAL